jgi:hypothetical protein
MRFELSPTRFGPLRQFFAVFEGCRRLRPDLSALPQLPEATMTGVREALRLTESQAEVRDKVKHRRA